MARIQASDVRGFYYAGSWGTSGLDLWQHFDSGTMAVEIARGKNYFPGWNVARFYLTHEAFARDPDRFLANLEVAISIFDRNGIQVMPVLFNRWRDPVLDFGGVSLEHILPGINKCRPEYFTSTDWSDDQDPASIQRLFANYIKAVMERYADDERIYAWDICGEPLMYVPDPENPLYQAELRWLDWVGKMCRLTGPSQPLTIGCGGGFSILETTEPFVDFISFHPYYIPDMPPGRSALQVNTKEGFEQFLDDAVALAKKCGKDLLAQETAWGAVVDADRVENMRYSLGELRKRGLGFMVVGLYHSLTADLHSSAFGPVGWPGRLEFINADGSLRSGHEAYNEF